MHAYMNVWDTLLISRWMTFQMNIDIYIKNMYKNYCTHMLSLKKLFTSTTCCNKKVAILHTTSLPVGMCYRINRKTNVLCQDKITSHPKIDFACIYATSLSWMHDVVYPMHTTWNYSDTGSGMSIDMSFLFLPVRFCGTPRLLYLKIIHIASRRVWVSFCLYIININMCYRTNRKKQSTKKLHQQIKIFFFWILGRFG